MSDGSVPLETLRQVPILRGLDDEECRRLGRVARLEEFPSGAVVLRQGDACQNLWVMLDGECEVVKQLTDGPGTREVVLATLRPLENFGEMSFFQAAPHSAAVSSLAGRCASSRVTIGSGNASPAPIFRKTSW